MMLHVASLLALAVVLALATRGRLLPLLAGFALAVSFGAWRLLADPSLDEAEAARLLLERGEAGFARYRAWVAFEALSPVVAAVVAGFLSGRRAVRRLEGGVR